MTQSDLLVLTPPSVEALVADLKQLCEIESPSSDPVAVNRVMDVVEGWARQLGADTHALLGGSRSFDFGVTDAPYVLVLLHADTVWPHGTLGKMPLRTERDKLYGPGTYDMKGGIVGTFHALRALGAEGWPAGGIRVLLSPDEEIGSPSSRESIEAAARQARVVLVPEPPVAESHNLKTGRKGTGEYTLTLHGISSHAGNRPELGASAITAAAEAVQAVQALADSTQGTNVSAGKIVGGSATNVIPDECQVVFDVRVAVLSEAERLDRRIRAWQPSDSRVRVEVTGELDRPPFEQSPETLKLFALAEQIAVELGFTLGHEIVGGGSDGNLTAPFAPTLDGLGAPGDGAHALHEHVRLDRWPQHVELLTRLLARV